MAEQSGALVPVWLSVGDEPMTRLGWVPRAGPAHDLADLHRLAADAIERDHGPRRPDPLPPEPPVDQPPPEEPE